MSAGPLLGDAVPTPAGKAVLVALPGAADAPRPAVALAWLACAAACDAGKVGVPDRILLNVYRWRFSRGRALRMMATGRGSDFDPEILDALVALSRAGAPH